MTMYHVKITQLNKIVIKTIKGVKTIKSRNELLSDNYDIH